MRFISWKWLWMCAFLTNIGICVILWSYLDSRCQFGDEPRIFSPISHRLHRDLEVITFEKNDSESQLAQKILFVIREFEFFENDVVDTVKSILNVFPTSKIVIVSDKLPYPPIQINKKLPQANIHLVNLHLSLDKPQSTILPNNYLDREHVILVPDSVRVETASQIINMMKLHFEKPDNIIAVPVVGERFKCLFLNVSLRFWTMKFKENKDSDTCDAMEGNLVLLLTRSFLIQLSHPFARPLMDSLFIQSALRQVKVNLVRSWSFSQGKKLFMDPHLKWKHDTLEQDRRSKLYQNFGIKKVLKPESRVEWYGCTKTSSRCFGTVFNDMPDYLFENRWTPPCCLENLRQTARYVFSILEKCGVRYWLEGGSLLGAARNGDIIPWDYDVDIGIYKDDISKCEWLKNSQKQSIIDSQNFVWEKAREGDFIRVQFSESNHLHVDIFPFYSRNGTMTKDTWFINHKQDMEFPEHFLVPLIKIKFVGVLAYAPNNYHKFLELKFGRGVIENPQYPDPEMLKYSRFTVIRLNSYLYA